jgi:spore maturation protein CgeB
VKIRYFTHALTSCWNHGNAHFLRGVLTELVLRGHDVVALEPASGWSKDNLVADAGDAALAGFADRFPELRVETYEPGDDVAERVADADLVVVHEWTDPEIVAALGRAGRMAGRGLLLFHDTHHRAVSDPEAIRAFDLDGYDGVLAFGAALADVYRGWGWGDRVFVWHEAADTRRFKPPAAEAEREGLVFIGNWGDGERTEELERFLFRPARAAGVPLTVHGVRYPPEVVERLTAGGASYRGWVANADVPDVFARHVATVHVPRRLYVERLPGIPTIRVFEALACGIPLVCAPWRDEEGLFSPGEDFFIVRGEREAARTFAALAADRAMREEVATHGLLTLLARHTCSHRADELLDIARRLDAPASLETA